MMDQSTMTSDEVITVSAYINFELIVQHLIEAAKKHEPVAMDKEIININSTSRLENIPTSLKRFCVESDYYEYALFYCNKL